MDVQTIEKDLEEYANLDTVDKLIDSLTALVKDNDDLEIDIENLSQALSTIEVTEADLADLEDWLTIEQDVAKIQEEVDDLDHLSIQSIKLNHCLLFIEELLGKTEWLDHIISAKPEVEELTKMVGQHKEQFDLWTLIFNKLTEAHKCEVAVEKKEEEILELTNRAMEIVEQTGVCPLCGEKIKPGKNKHIEEWLK
jgi:DNA repair exonuclease SbcCD ATPase subunit